MNAYWPAIIALSNGIAPVCTAAGSTTWLREAHCSQSRIPGNGEVGAATAGARSGVKMSASLA